MVPWSVREGRPVGDWWDRNIVEPHKLPLLLCFAAFITTFLTTRTVTRLIRAGRGPFHDNTTSGGVHIHHSVPGIILLIIGAGLGIGAPADAPWRELAGILVGIGTALVLDEFALILHLQDVYWTEEGRGSVEAVALVGAAMGFGLVGLNPIGVEDQTFAEVGLRLSATVLVLLTVVAAAVCALKGKYRTALVAMVLPFAAFYGAVRLARPGSEWDRRRYGSRPGRRAEAAERAHRFDRRWDPGFRRLGDLIAGRPTDELSSRRRAEASASGVTPPGVTPPGVTAPGTGPAPQSPER